MREKIVVLFFFVVATATPKVNAVDNKATRQREEHEREDEEHLNERRQGRQPDVLAAGVLHAAGRCARYADELEKHLLEKNSQRQKYLPAEKHPELLTRDEQNLIKLLEKLPDPSKLPDPNKQLSQPQPQPQPQRQTGNLWIAAGLSAAILFPMILTVLVFRNLEKQRKSGRKTHAVPIDDLVGDTN